MNHTNKHTNNKIRIRNQTVVDAADKIYSSICDTLPIWAIFSLIEMYHTTVLFRRC